jgi:serine/threonine protein kinase
MHAHNRPTLSLYRTLQTIGPAPAVAPAPVGPPLPRRGLHLGGRYRLDDLIAEGGTARVYRGRHLLMDQDVAIKVLRPEISSCPEAVERFLDEARTLAKLRHPNIVTVHDFDRTDSLAWMVMELLEGETLADRRQRVGRLTWSSVRRILLQLCSALRAAHEQGILHRDIKPENCVCIPNGADREFIKIVDFGISSIRAGDHVQSLEPRGYIAGTPGYMAPERMFGRGDERSDIYSTGVLMYELLTGTLPFTGVFPSQRKVEVEPPSLRTAQCCSRAVDRVVLRALAYEPEERFQSMRELANAIRSASEGEMPDVVLTSPPPVRVPVRRGTPSVFVTPALADEATPPVAESTPDIVVPSVVEVEDDPPPVTIVTPPGVPVPLPREAHRPRSRVRGLLSATAAIALALGISPIASAIENVYAQHTDPQIEEREAERALMNAHSIATPKFQHTFPKELMRFASHPWQSDCER